MSGATVSFTLRATQGTYTNIQSGAVTTAAVPSPTGFHSYRIVLPTPSALRVSLTANTAYRNLRTFLNLIRTTHEQCCSGRLHQRRHTAIAAEVRCTP